MCSVPSFQYLSKSGKYSSIESWTVIYLVIKSWCLLNHLIYHFSRLSDKSGIITDGPGNYSIDVKCSWLIDASDTPNATIRLHFNSFATECGWDHLYIFDGDSVHAPLLGVFR